MFASISPKILVSVDEHPNGLSCVLTDASRTQGLTVNAIALAPSARRKPCKSFTSGMKLWLEIGGKTIFYHSNLLLHARNDNDVCFSRSVCPLAKVSNLSVAHIDRHKKLPAYQTHTSHTPTCAQGGSHGV
ncbi:MAG: hypothetical protein EPN56_03590 [Rhodanobacter sp.]|nr:MAG: hypothetical protein EPN78_08655 [Rhodanobacter sp.]TAM08736.1 MAG: hypothetical protein EPN66_11680 [Rhodanobacter sp.]TAM36778.1 MAG: hypothetical protein EPN56_03590 [Rhodanobacter sp.]